MGWGLVSSRNGALRATDHILHETDAGNHCYGLDGTGVVAQQLVAVIGIGVVLTASYALVTLDGACGHVGHGQTDP